MINKKAKSERFLSGNNQDERNPRRKMQRHFPAAAS
jgi:hypothetical protein